MKQAGRAHWLTIAGILSVIVVLGLFFFVRDTAGQTAEEFMLALGDKNLDTLVELSYYPGVTKEELRNRWDFAVNKAGKYYRYAWRITNLHYTTDTTANATLQVEGNLGPSSFEEKYELPLIKEGGRWKVALREIPRTMYPALPR